MTSPPLVSVRSLTCAALHLEFLYTPVTDVAHVSGRTDDDPFRDRFEIRLTDAGLPAGTSFDYLTPQPLQFFFSVLRKHPDGSLVDLTAPQIDAHHTGQPQVRTFQFASTGAPQTDLISYFALATIVPDDAILPGEYIVRIARFEVVRVGQSTATFEPIELPLTILAGPSDP